MQVPSNYLHWSLQHRENSPIFQKLMAQQAFNQTSTQDYQGQAPNVFVGRHGYPDINMGFLSTPHYDGHDDPKTWAHDVLPIKRIIELRTQLINSRFEANVHKLTGNRMDTAKEIAMADRPADVEVNLVQRPQFKLTFDQAAAPFGPSAELERLRITHNPHVPTRIDKMVSDTDVKATVALSELFKSQVDEHYLTKLLSVGTLGIKRKLVPTRWAITAVDDTLGKKLLVDIRTNDTAGYLAFTGSHLGNYFIVLFLEDLFSYELFEMFYKSPEFTTDYEPFAGRSAYAEQTAGGYYASRLPILEYLTTHKQQASVLVLRIITDEYYAPLGVWVVREAVRNAMSKPPISFGSKELLLEYAKKFALKKFSYDLTPVLANSKVAKEAGIQKRLSSYT